MYIWRLQTKYAMAYVDANSPRHATRHERCCLNKLHNSLCEAPRKPQLACRPRVVQLDHSLIFHFEYRWNLAGHGCLAWLGACTQHPHESLGTPHREADLSGTTVRPMNPECRRHSRKGCAAEDRRSDVGAPSSWAPRCLGGPCLKTAACRL